MTDAGPIRVLLADDHPIVREGLRTILTTEPGLRLVGEAASGDEAVALARSLRPDVVLMDLRMPGGDGVEATKRILDELPAIRILVLTTYDTDSDILRAIGAGATGYMLKDSSRADLVRAIRAAGKGETVLAPSVADHLVASTRRPRQTPLSAREVEVLGLVARGLTNGEIGQRLVISQATVKTHLLRAFTKLGVSDRTAAVTVAIERGILAARG
ncbi:MAG TPA: response regulator transcription factor [Streptosporangiaceae bacterium]